MKLQPIPATILLVISLLSHIAVADPAAINVLTDFEFLAKADDAGAFHTSETGRYRQKTDRSQWIIKKGPDRWLINEFVAGKIYRAVLGNNAVGESKLILDESTGQRLLATKSHSGFTQVDINTHSFGNIPFKCAAGNCACTKTKCTATNLSDSIIHGLKVVGFERAAIASLFLDDDDIDGGNNFAMLDLQDHFLITRIDFDDSLKFFDRLGITELNALDIMSAVQIASMGISQKMITSILKQQLLPYENADLKLLLKKLKLGSGVLNESKAQIALQELTEKPFAAYAELLDEGYSEVANYFSDNEIGEIYNTRKALCSKHRYATDLDKRLGHDFAQYDCRLTSQDSHMVILAEFTKFMLQRRYNDLRALVASKNDRTEL